MLNNRNIYSVLLVFCFVVNANAQTAIDWLQNSNSVIDTTKHVKVDLTMKVLAGSISGELLETNSGSYKKAGDKVYTSFGPLISIQKDGQSILVDKLNGSIYFTTDNNAKKNNNYLAMYKELKPYLDTVYIAMVNDKYVDIVCKYKQVLGVMYGRIDTRIDKKTLLPEKINLFLNDGMPFYEEELKGRKPIISIEYTNWQLNTQSDFSVFDFDKYIIKKDGAWMGVGDYKNYEITTLY
jgi:hypothetical protein